MVLQRRTVVALISVVAALAVLITLLATAPSDSSVGRFRTSLGDAADSVGKAITVPSPAPSVVPVAAPTVPPERLRASQVALLRARGLVSAVGADLAAMDRAQAAGDAAQVVAHRNKAILGFNSLTDVLEKDDILAGPDYDGVYGAAEALQKRLAALSPR